MIDTFDLIRPRENIPLISPAFRWTQSLREIFIEVKFATRFDSPACLDISEFDFHFSEDRKELFMEALCRNDGKLLRYKL